MKDYTISSATSDAELLAHAFSAEDDDPVIGMLQSTARYLVIISGDEQGRVSAEMFGMMLLNAAHTMEAAAEMHRRQVARLSMAKGGAQ